MSWMNQVSSLLQRYRGAAPPSNLMADFAKLAGQAPASVVSSGLAEAFRSASTPPFEEMISQLFGQSNGAQRAGILNHLIAAAGPAVLSGDLLASLKGAPSGVITSEQAQQVRPEAVRQLAELAAKNDPSVIDTASAFYAQHPALVETLGADALAVIMSRVSERPRALTLGML